MRALRQGMHAKVAMTYFEWAGSHHTQIIVPWRLIDGPETADSFAADIARARYTRASRTSISSALLFGATLFDGSGYRGLRRVIDVSGDGVNNNGPLVTLARDEVLAKGITINGLPIMLKRPMSSTMDIDNLDIYFEDCVIGGPGAFVIADQGARAVQGGDPHQAHSGNRRPHAGAASHPGRGAQRRASPAPSASRSGRSAGGIERALPQGGGNCDHVRLVRSYRQTRSVMLLRLIQSRAALVRPPA